MTPPEGKRFARVVTDEFGWSKVWTEETALFPSFGFLREANGLCDQINVAFRARLKKEIEAFREKAAMVVEEQTSPVLLGCAPNSLWPTAGKGIADKLRALPVDGGEGGR